MSNRNYCDNSWGRQANPLAISRKKFNEVFEMIDNDKRSFDECLGSNNNYRCRNCSECCNRDRECDRGRREDGNRVQLRGIQLQLQDNTIQTIANGANIIFNVLASRQSPYIHYDNTTGLVTVRKSGIYHFEWSVSTEGILVGTDTGVTFSIITSASHNIKASSPVAAGQIIGNALIEIIASPRLPVTLRLVNETNGTVGLAQVPVKANLIVSHII